MKARKVKRLDPEATLEENAARIISLRLAEMRSFTPAALDPANSVAQHDMRIAAKRLRYVLEATGFCFGKPAQTAARRARDLQGLLGEVHDCDVMLPAIDTHVADLRAEDAAAVRAKAGDAQRLDPAIAARAPHRTAYRGLQVLTVYVQAQRDLLFDRFLAFWSAQEEAGTWDRLDRAVTRAAARDQGAPRCRGTHREGAKASWRRPSASNTRPRSVRAKQPPSWWRRRHPDDYPAAVAGRFAGASDDRSRTSAAERSGPPCIAKAHPRGHTTVVPPVGTRRSTSWGRGGQAAARVVTGTKRARRRCVMSLL